MSSERSLPASNKKRLKLRRDGQGLKVSMLPGALGIGVFVVFSLMISGRSLVKIKGLLHYCLSMQGSIEVAVHLVVVGVVLPALSILILIGAVSMAAQVLQYGAIFNPGLAIPKLSRLASGLNVKRLCSIARDLVRLSLYALLFLIGSLGFLIWFLHKNLVQFGGALNGALLSRGMMTLAIMLLLIALVDFLLRKREYEREIGMSREELRQEHKEEEGDGLIRALRRAYHRSLLVGQLKEHVKNSKCIVIGDNGRG